MTPQDPASQPNQRLFIWWAWFLAGFIFVFVFMLVVWSVLYSDSRATYKMSLWQFYYQQLKQTLRFSRPAGTSGGTVAMLKVLVEHTLASAGGGLIAVTIGWLCLGRVRRG